MLNCLGWKCREKQFSLDDNDNLVWSKDLETHSCGEFSFAVCGANAVTEDFSQVETGSNAIFVGIYDGHGGLYAAHFVRDHLFKHIIEIAIDHNDISQETICNSIASIEDKYLKYVRQNQISVPSSVVSGTSCLAAIIWKGVLMIGNLGDSRAVLGHRDGSRSRKIVGELLTEDHSLTRPEIRSQLRDAHPNDRGIVELRGGVYAVKGTVQVSRSIGNAFLKRREFQVDPTYEELGIYRFRTGFPTYPAITANPALVRRDFRLIDEFLIFASYGLWEHLTEQQAAEIVDKYPREGIARRLLKAAQREAAKKKSFPYPSLQNVEQGERKKLHDEITVVVVFLNHDMLGKRALIHSQVPKSFSPSITDPFITDSETSQFRHIDDLM